MFSPARSTAGRSASCSIPAPRWCRCRRIWRSELGLAAGAQQQSITANGTVATRATRVEALAFGPFEMRGVPASLNPGMAGDQVLLGMSVLKHLEFTQRGDTLILRALGS